MRIDFTHPSFLHCAINLSLSTIASPSAVRPTKRGQTRSGLLAPGLYEDTSHSSRARGSKTTLIGRKERRVYTIGREVKGLQVSVFTLRDYTQGDRVSIPKILRGAGGVWGGSGGHGKGPGKGGIRCTPDPNVQHIPAVQPCYPYIMLYTCHESTVQRRPRDLQM